MLREVLLANVGAVSLELSKEFVGSREVAIRFLDARDSLDDELVEAIIPNKVKEASWKFVENGGFVVLNKVYMGFTCKGEYKVGCESDTPSSHY